MWNWSIYFNSMQLFEITLVLLAIAVVLLQWARRLRVPYPAMLALVGGCVAVLPFAPHLSIEPSLALAFSVPSLPPSWAHRRLRACRVPARCLGAHLAAASPPRSQVVLVLLTTGCVVVAVGGLGDRGITPWRQRWRWELIKWRRLDVPEAAAAAVLQEFNFMRRAVPWR